MAVAISEINASSPHPDVAALQARIRYQDEVIENQKRGINKLQAEIAWREALDASPKFDASTKLFIAKQAKAEQHEKPNEDGRYRIDMAARADEMGMSPSSVSRKAALLVEHGFIESDGPVKYVKKNGEEVDLVFGRLAPDLLTEDGIIGLDPMKLKSWGGDHYICKSCGGRIKRKTRILAAQEIVTCTSCGEITVYQPKWDINSPLPPSEQVVPDQEDGHEQVVPEENLQPLTIPSTPPILHLVPDQESQKGPQPGEPFMDSEREAAQLLLAIAGQHSSHIKMCKDGNAKYITVVDSPLDLADMRTHLRGYQTKGLKGRSDEGETRALCIDADTSEEWHRLEEAARMLAVVGFKPLLIPSPVTDSDHKGGGHFWLIFESLVDAYSAFQTIYDYTGDLLQGIKDCWPGGGINIRLPGGKYVYNCDAWCDLYDAYGCKLSHDGAGAALALLEHQTPASLIVAHTKPEPQRTEPAQPHGGYLEKDVARHVITDFNASHSWNELLGKPNRSGKYLAPWRNDRNPNVKVYPNDLAYDHSTHRWVDRPFDKYDAYCFTEGGVGWEAFKERDLNERCAKLREQQPVVIKHSDVAQAKEVTQEQPLEALARELGASIAVPHTCGCQLYWDRQGEPYCCWCHPKPRAGWTDEQRARLGASRKVQACA